jgi:cytochrome b561
MRRCTCFCFALPVSGWVVNSSTGFPLRWFKPANVPAIAAKSKSLHAISTTVHEDPVLDAGRLALGHAAQRRFTTNLFQRDETLARMLPRNWLRVPSTSGNHPHV